MKQGNKDKVDEISEEDSRIGSRHAGRKKVKEKVRPKEDNNGSFLAGSIWKTTHLYDHNILVYPDLPTYRKIYSESAKQALDSNEIVFLVTTYDSFDRIKDTLRKNGISVNNEIKEGNLIILDSVKTYQIDIHGAVNFITTVAKRAERDGKAGVFGLTEMGSFFIAEQIASLTQYEQSLPKKWDINFKSTCTYHKDDFANLSKQQQETILSAHNRAMP
jgi:hypothetical protein